MDTGRHWEAVDGYWEAMDGYWEALGGSGWILGGHGWILGGTGRPWMDTGRHWEALGGSGWILGGSGWILGGTGGHQELPGRALGVSPLSPPPAVTKTNLSVHEDKNRVPYVKVGVLGGGRVEVWGGDPTEGVSDPPPPPPGLHGALCLQP